MITALRLQDYRSYKDASFEFAPSVNIVVGPNASGKTNLLEAVLVLARGSSYRARDHELVQFGRPWARLDADLATSGHRTVKIINQPDPSKAYELDGKTYQRLSLAHSLPVVLFEPNHLLMLTGSPDRRRDYLDDLLEQTMAGYGTWRRHYRRALAQRNALLKRPGQVAKSQLFPWDLRLSELAGQIVRARSELAIRINQDLPKLYKKLSGSSTKVTADYDSRWSPDNYETHLLKRLETGIREDRERGFTGAGPHREDLILSFNGHPAADAASRGEIRTAVLALKIIELKIIEAARDQTPLLLLDDVFSELDGHRRHALTNYLAPYQTFITTTDADAITSNFSSATHRIALG